MKRSINVGRAIGKIVSVILALWVGEEVISAVVSTINITGGYFSKAFQFLGLDNPGTGILAVIGVIGVASIAMEFVDISF